MKSRTTRWWSRARSRVKGRLETHVFAAPYVMSPAGGTPELEGRAVVLTGAGGAIGRAIAARLSVEGALVHLCGRTEESLRDVRAEVEALGGRALVHRVDLTDAASIDELFAAVERSDESLAGLVNCAGGSARDRAVPLHEQSVGVIDDLIAVNLRAPILCCRAAAPLLIRAGGGSIVNIGSVVANHGLPHFTDYAASKAGVAGLTKSLATELGAHRVRVNTVTPGIVPRGTANGNRVEGIRDTNYLRGIGTAESVAEAVAFLLTPRADFVTGQELVVDGGRSLGLKGS